ncbi:hypothetical protein [Nonomuraea sp. NPDC046570]|uniref:hypothetical protein n=1 Tax=Nonomuraea sp. NPDC046570 TaxID=3155255 RepID=UPI0033F0466B
MRRVNHGIGVEAAIRQTRERRKQWLERERRQDDDIIHIEVSLVVQADALF